MLFECYVQMFQTALLCNVASCASFPDDPVPIINPGVAVLQVSCSLYIAFKKHKKIISAILDGEHE